MFGTTFVWDHRFATMGVTHNLGPCIVWDHGCLGPPFGTMRVFGSWVFLTGTTVWDGATMRVWDQLRGTSCLAPWLFGFIPFGTIVWGPCLGPLFRNIVWEFRLGPPFGTMGVWDTMRVWDHGLGPWFGTWVFGTTVWGRAFGTMGVWDQLFGTMGVRDQLFGTIPFGNHLFETMGDCFVYHCLGP